MKPKQEAVDACMTLSFDRIRSPKVESPEGKTMALLERLESRRQIEPVAAAKPGERPKAPTPLRSDP